MIPSYDAMLSEVARRVAPDGTQATGHPAAGAPVRLCEKPISLDRGRDSVTLTRGRPGPRRWLHPLRPDWPPRRPASSGGSAVYLFRPPLRACDRRGRSPGRAGDLRRRPHQRLAGPLVGEVGELRAGARVDRLREIGDSPKPGHALRVGALGVIENRRSAGTDTSPTEVVEAGHRAIDNPTGTLPVATPAPGHRRPCATRAAIPVGYAAECRPRPGGRDGTPPRSPARMRSPTFDMDRAAEQSWRTGRPVTVDAVGGGHGTRAGRVGLVGAGRSALPGGETRPPGARRPPGRGGQTAPAPRRARDRLGGPARGRPGRSCSPTRREAVVAPRRATSHAAGSRAAGAGKARVCEKRWRPRWPTPKGVAAAEAAGVPRRSASTAASPESPRPRRGGRGGAGPRASSARSTGTPADRTGPGEEGADLRRPYPRFDTACHPARP